MGDAAASLFELLLLRRMDQTASDDSRSALHTDEHPVRERLMSHIRTCPLLLLGLLLDRLQSLIAARHNRIHTQPYRFSAAAYTAMRHTTLGTLLLSMPDGLH